MAPSMDSQDKKLDALLKGQDAQFKELREMFMASQVRVTALESDMTALQREVKSLKETVNMREQQSRSLSVRIVSLPNSEDEQISKLVYDCILKPMLVVAKERNFITAVPQMATVISNAYRIRPRGGASAAGSHPI